MKKDDKVCPNCKLVQQQSEHLNKCMDVGWTALIDESISKVEQWMEQKGQTEPKLTFWIGKII